MQTDKYVFDMERWKYLAQSDKLEEELKKTDSYEELISFSTARKYLLDWVPFAENSSVLEYESGVGALTGMLADKADKVTCIEKNEKYTEINRIRNKDRNNIRYLRNVDEVGDEEKFDYIIMVNVNSALTEVDSKKEIEKLIAKSGSYLKKNGVLILAVNNNESIHLLSGGVLGTDDEPYDGKKGISKQDLLAILERNMFTHTKFYYPMDNAIFPMCIYSDELLPNEGDIPNQVFDISEQSFRMFDETKIFDQTIRNKTFDRYANSFLVFASESELQMNVIYCKNNYNRSSQYQTKTLICKENEELVIYKKALNPCAQSHIQRFGAAHKLIADLYPEIQVLPADMNKNEVTYKFINGISLDDAIRAKSDSVDAYINNIKKCIAIVFKVNTKYESTFQRTEQFREIFGDTEVLSVNAVCPCNLDMALDNMIIDATGKIKLYDYEWVVDFPVPENYVIFRMLCRLYDKYKEEICTKYSLESFIACFGIEKKEYDIYRKMEDAFIANIYSCPDPAWYSNKCYYIRKDYAEIRRELNRAEELTVKLKNTEKEYLQTVDILHDTEKKYLTTINNLDNAAKIVEESQKKVNDLQKELNDIKASAAWKCTIPMRKVMKLAKKVRKKGVKGSASALLMRIKRTRKNIASNDLLEVINVNDSVLNRQKTAVFEKMPLISIITPLFNTPEEFLVELLESVKNQTYRNWELCLVNFSTQKFDVVDTICKKYCRDDARIVYRVAEKNEGIADNTNLCISYASGEYIALLDHDDVLHPSALYKVVEEINNSDADFVYTDEVKFAGNLKNVYAPNFKPDFSRDELQAHNFICHLNVYSRALYEKVGGYRREFDGSQDHDIVLRLTEKAKKIVHIPEILYYWRVHENSVAQNISAKSYATTSGEAAVTEQLKRLGENITVKSVINNIPIYRKYVSENKEMKIALVLWGAKKKEEYADINEFIKTQDVISEVHYCGENLAAEEINCIMETVETPWVWFIYGKGRIKSENLLNELSVYYERKDVATIDMKIVAADGTLLSGGCYLSGDSGMPVQIRCMGGPEDYAGYENALLYNRVVSASLGYSTLVNVAIWRKDDKLRNENLSIVRYSYMQGRNGFLNIWTPFIQLENVETNAKEDIIQGLCGLHEYYETKDPFFNNIIKKLKLE